MRSKEIKKGIENFILFKDALGITISKGDSELYIDNLEEAKNDVETVLSYIETLEELPNKIRDKIKELEEKLKYIGGCDNDCKKCFNSERENSFEYCFAYHQIKVLKSIIGE